MDAFQPGNLRSSVDCSNFGVIEAQTLSKIVSVMPGELNKFTTAFASFDGHSMLSEAVGIQLTQNSSGGHCMERGVDGTNLRCAQRYGTRNR